MATVYQCIYRDRGITTHCATFNQGKRAKCSGCKSRVRGVHGHAIVAEWRGDGRYQLAEAIREYATYGAAEKAASVAYERDNQSNLVARFIFKTLV